jgi:nucleotide-binding universal stress UspA family protein
MGVFKHVLVATDFSDSSSRALDLALALARDGAELTVVHVCEVPAFTELSGSIDLVTSLTDAARSRLEEHMGPIRNSFPAAKAVLEVGTAWEQILAAAAVARADVIVMGTHGRRGFAHALLGSAAERVVRLSQIPVLTVPARASR